MIFFVITSFIIAVTCIFLSALVYTKDKKNPVNRCFSLFAAAIFLWSASYVIWLLQTDPESALFWSRMLNLGATFIPITYLHWVFVFLNKGARAKKFLIFGYALTFTFAIFSFSNIYIKGVTPISIFPYWPQANWLYYFYLALNYTGMVFYASYLLFRGFRSAVGPYRQQIKYVFIGSVVGFIGGATNFPLMLGIDLFPPVGNPLVIAYPAFAAYAIVRYRLLNIRIILTQFLVGLIALMLFIEAMLAETFYQYLYKWGSFFLFIYFGYLLIKSVLNEIKRREQLEELTTELTKTQKQLEKLDKAKSEFLSIASHQLRAPLTAIKGYISMMLEESYGKVGEKMQKPLRNIYTSNQRLIKLINTLLDISRIEAGRTELEPEKTSLEDVISNIVDELKIEAGKKNLYLKWEKPKMPLPQILIDRSKIRDVVSNIIDNAIKYTEQGGVLIKIKKLTTAKLQIIISDTGKGITKEELAGLFKSFSRGVAGNKFFTEGTGLGLYVAKKFIEMHNGRIWVESQGKNKGSTFYIELPLKG